MTDTTPDTPSSVDIGFECSRAFALMDQGKAYASANNYRDAADKFQETISVLMAVRSQLLHHTHTHTAHSTLTHTHTHHRSCPW